jgi:hypothetical protein
MLLHTAASAYAAPTDEGLGEGSKSKVDATDSTPVRAVTALASPLVLAWSVKIGSTAGDDGGIGYGQIAARGPLIAVASRGIPGASDELDGVHVFDGRSPPLAGRGDHRVRFIPSEPERSVASPRAEARSNARGTDAIGVALDGDFIVFGTFGGAVRKVRLDGVPLWSFEAWPARTRPGLPALADLDRDGVRDVIVPVVPMGECSAPGACRDAWRVAAIVLDGRTGKQTSQRRVGEGLQAFGHPLWSCAERIVAFIAARNDFVVACAGSGGEREPRGTRPGRNDVVSRLELLVQGGADESLVRERSLGSGDPAAVVDALARVSSRGDLKGDPDAWLEGARRQLSQGAQSAVSLGDVDGDGGWDALVVQGGELRVYATGLQGDAPWTFWRGNSAASGEVEPGDSPAAYASRIGARDKTRWLKLERPPSDEAFSVWTGKLAERRADPVLLPEPSPTPSITTVLGCDASRYALNEGELLEFSRSGWRRTLGSPWPITALGCVDQNLVLETNLRSGEGLSRSYVLASSTQWKVALRYMLLGLCLAVVSAAWFLFRQRASSLQGGSPRSSEDARRAVVDDLPRTRVADAHPSQLRLLRGLLNMLDNDDTRPPLTLALFGEWGSGKSSLMGMLRSELKQTGRYIDVWFNAWRFQREPELAPALLQCIVDEVARQTDWVTRVALLWQRIRGARLVTVALFCAGAGALAVVIGVCVKWLASGAQGAGVGGQLGALVSLLALLATGTLKVLDPLTKVFAIEPARLLNSKDGKQRIQFVREFSAEFERIASRLPRGTRLCIFIDDLDRCTPARIVEVLETLSMLADTGCAFFVLAIDPITVRRAVELQYKDLLRLARREDAAEARNFGVRYLEKMITLGVSVPALAAQEVEPDLRIVPMPARPSFVRWLRSRVVPEPPLLLALALLAVGGTLAVEHAQVVDDMFAALMHATFHDAGIKPRGIEPPAVHAAVRPAAAAQLPKSSEQGVRTVAQGLETTGGSANALPRVRAQIAATQLEPAVVTARALEPPSAARRLGRILMASMLAFSALSLAAIGALLLSERRRRKRIDLTRPIGKDSAVFAHALAECKRGLPANPRNVVRFTNASRFLYHVVAASETAARAPAWERDFFAEVHARWSGVRAGAAPEWLQRELDHWLPTRQTRRS